MGEVKPGDKVQTTCVYNSMERTEDTVFGTSTYEEMCVVALYITFETPPPTADSGIDFIVDLNLRTFRCEVDDENHTTDVWQGILEENEDPRNIYFDHPIDESDMCTFPVEFGVGLIQGAGLTDTAMTFETRNCPESMTEESIQVEVSDVEESDVKVSDVEVSDVSSSFSLSTVTALVAMTISTFMVSLLS